MFASVTVNTTHIHSVLKPIESCFVFVFLYRKAMLKAQHGFLDMADLCTFFRLYDERQHNKQDMT